MERIKGLKIVFTEIVLAAVSTTTFVGLRHAEEQSRKIHLISNTDILEMYASCDSQNTLGSPIRPPTNFAFSAHMKEHEKIVEARMRGVRADWLGQLTVEQNSLFPGRFKFLYEAHAVNRYNPNDIIVPRRTIEADLFCPLHPLQALVAPFQPPKKLPIDDKEIFRKTKVA